MSRYQSEQGKGAFGDALMGTEYVQNSGALGALAQALSMGIGGKIRRAADESASEYAGRIFEEEQRQAAAQAEAERRAQLEAEQRSFDRAVSLEGVKGEIRNRRVPDSIRALEVLAERPDLARLDLDRKSASAPRTTVNAGNYQKPFETALAKADAEAYTQLRNRAGAAQQAQNSIDTLDSILGNAQTGKMNEALAMAGQYFGTEAGANFQATNAIVQEQVLNLMGQLKGPATDQDAARIEAQIPNMGTDPRARKVVFDYLRKKAAQEVETFSDADRFLSERGNLQGWVPRHGAFTVDTSPIGGQAPTPAQ